MSAQMTHPGPLYYDDLSEGQRLESGAATLTRDEIVAFGHAYDPQPQHLDEEQAGRSQFGALIASGWHTAAVSMRLQVEAMLSRVPGGAMGAQVDKLAWMRPVHPGDRIRVVIEVLALRPSRSRPDKGLATLRTTTLNQDGVAVQEMSTAVLLPRRPA